MQKQLLINPDQRFDVPHYDTMMELITQEFTKYNKHFANSKNRVVKNWKVLADVGLKAKVDRNTDSLLLNSERVGLELFSLRETTCDELTINLEPNSSNYVEVEIYSTTTAEDEVAFWDTTANSGEGEEFIQNVDTVLDNATHRLVSNTTSFSVSRPDRVPLAIISTDAVSVTAIADVRDFFFSLSIDWDFDGTAYSTRRTDKTITSHKNDTDAIKTAIKEWKNLGAWAPAGEANWYDLPGPGTMALLERFNYMLVDGGSIHWDVPRPAVGTLFVLDADSDDGIAIGDSVQIGGVTFNFVASPGGPEDIVIVDGYTFSQVRDKIRIAVNAHPTADVTGSDGQNNILNLVSNTPGTAGNVAIVETIASGATMKPQGMSDGISTNSLSWSAGLRIIVPGRSFDYTIDAGAVSLNDDQIAYVVLPNEGVVPGSPLTVIVDNKEDYLIDQDNIRNYMIAYRSGTRVHMHGVELEDGETSQLGDGITAEWITASGLVDEFDSTPPYWSTHFIDPTVSWTNAISIFDDLLFVLNGMLVGEIYTEYVESDGTAAYNAGAFVPLPPKNGVGPAWEYQTGINQLEVFYGGRLMILGVDWDESANLGPSLGNRIELLRDVEDGYKIIFRIQAGGYQDTVGENNTASNVGTGAGAIFKQKTGVDLELRNIKAGANMNVSTIGNDIILESTATGGGGGGGNVLKFETIKNAVDIVSRIAATVAIEAGWVDNGDGGAQVNSWLVYQGDNVAVPAHIQNSESLAFYNALAGEVPSALKIYKKDLFSAKWVELQSHYWSELEGLPSTSRWFVIPNFNALVAGVDSAVYISLP